MYIGIYTENNTCIIRVMPEYTVQVRLSRYIINFCPLHYHYYTRLNAYRSYASAEDAHLVMHVPRVRSYVALAGPLPFVSLPRLGKLTKQDPAIIQVILESKASILRRQTALRLYVSNPYVGSAMCSLLVVSLLRCSYVANFPVPVCRLISPSLLPVSYTHLDVYKRQSVH